MTPLTITLPWPESRLWPNRHTGEDWRFRQRPKVAAKELGFCLGRETGARLTSAPVPVTYTFHAPTAGRYDLEGAYGACKAYTDGLARALEVDDAYFGPVLLRRGAPEKPGKVVVTFGELAL